MICSTAEVITQQAVRDTRLKVHPPGTVLIAMYGGFRQIGRTGLLGIEAATNQAITAITCNPQRLNSRFLLMVLNARNEYWRSVASSSRKDPNITRADIETFPLPLPPLRQQAALASFAALCEQEGRALDAVVAAKRGFKRAFTQQLLTGAIRFPQFRQSYEYRKTGFGELPRDWEYVRVDEIAHEVAIRAGTGHIGPVLACTKYDGLVSSLSYFGRRIFSADTSSYKVVRRGQFAFPANHIEEGSIGLLREHPEGLVSPIYVVFEPTDRAVPEFLYSLFKSETYRQIFSAATNSSVNRRGSLRWTDFAKLRVPLPALDEQQTIAETLLALDQEILSLVRLSELLAIQKRALLNGLLSGDLRLSAK